MKKTVNKKAQTLLEYAIIFGTVTAVLITMNIYIKRGVQGRVKSMADNLINDGKEALAVVVDPDIETTSNTATTTGQVGDQPNLVENTYTGGGRQLAMLEQTHIDSNSRTVDRKSKPITPVVPSEAGAAEEVEHDAEEEFVRSEWQKSIDVDFLKSEIDRYLEYAGQLELRADILEEQGKAVYKRIYDVIGQWYIVIIIPVPISWILKLMDKTLTWAEAEEIMSYAHPETGCQQEACLKAALELYRAGRSQIDKAKQMRQEASDLRREAQEMQKRIDLLSG